MSGMVKETVTSFFQAWKDFDKKKMYSLTQHTWRSEHTKKDISNLFSTRIKKYKITDIREHTPTVYDVDVDVRFKGKDIKLTARLICEAAPYTPSIDGEWGVNPVSVIRNIY